MITFSKLGKHGQLGNQLFQYSMLLGVSAKTGHKIRIPLNYKAQKKNGLVELAKFKISAKDFGRPTKFNQYREKGFGFDRNVFNQRNNTDFIGYYQTEKYFEHTSDIVRKEFTFIDSIDEFAKEYVNSFRESSNVVALHVRRGDYLDAPTYFHILTADYYRRAMEKASPDSQFFICSDDLGWCKENLVGKNIRYVESPSYVHDMAIMRYCDAHIISASSFSWWAAWLSGKDNVIAPYPWFPIDGPRGKYYFEDIIPERWVRQDVK